MERNSGPSGVGDIAALPMLGVSAVRSFGPATLKIRSAFGRGIRPVQTASRVGMLMGYGGSLLGAPLVPEQQSGTEFGADALVGRSFAFHVTRFDQRASGLIQPVNVAARVQTDSGPRFRSIGYELQNVGGITNRGWELQASLAEGPWSVGGTYSQVDSRVAKLGAHYSGDLETGDRMLEVPARTFGVNAGYMKGRWSASWALSRASDWINYDRIGLLQALGEDRMSDQPLAGRELRAFWMRYAGVTRVNARLGVNLARGMLLTVDGENLLDEQRGEPDNLTVLPGRTLSAGIRVSF
jgi:iron complex outermembrane receptor protein